MSAKVKPTLKKSVSMLNRQRNRRRRQVHHLHGSKVTDFHANLCPDTFDDILEIDDQRGKMKHATRIANPNALVFHIRDIGYTAIWDVVKTKNFILVMIIYVVVAVLQRNGWMSEDNNAILLRSVAEIDLLLVFLIIFYFGYCYSRYFEMYRNSLRICHLLEEMVIRVCNSYEEPDKIRDMWRYVNLMHILVYVKLSHVYTRDNFFLPIVKDFNLLPHEKERDFLMVLDMENTSRALNAVWMWCICLNKSAKVASDAKVIKKKGIFTTLMIFKEKWSSLMNSRNKLVIPYPYLYLVSFLVTAYLCMVAWLQGSYFTEDSNVLWGMIVPCLTNFIVSLSCMTLVYIGGTCPENRRSFVRMRNGGLGPYSRLHIFSTPLVRIRVLSIPSRRNARSFWKRSPRYKLRKKRLRIRSHDS